MRWELVMIMMAAFWILVVAVVVFRAASERAVRPAGAGLPETPLDILRRRYAAGHIGRDEYERMRQDLETDGSGAHQTRLSRDNAQGCRD